MSQSTFLLTSFDPFAGAETNQSQRVAKVLSSLLAAKGKVINLTVPTVYDLAGEQAITQIEKMDPAHLVVISLGEGDHRTRFETRAYNLDDTPNMADNKGVVRAAQQIDQSKTEFLDMKSALRQFGAQISPIAGVELSDSAGRFVCNNFCFHLSTYCAAKQIAFLFFHVPKHTMAEEIKDPKLIARNLFNFLLVSGIFTS